MTHFPINKSLSDYPNIRPEFPFHLSVNRILRHYPVHRHDFMECALVMDGHGKELVNGIVHELRPGTFSLLLPHQFHEIHVTSAAPLILYNCMFDAELAVGGFGRAGIDGQMGAAGATVPFVHLEGKEFESVRRLFDDMLEEYESDRLQREILLGLKLAELIVWYKRTSGTPPDAAFTKLHGLATHRTMGKVLRQIHADYREELRLDRLAGEFGLSPSSLSEQFKRYTGCSFLKYVNELRVRHACSLLLTSELSSLEIAFEVGFRSFPTFARIFKQLKGMTPKAYRSGSRDAGYSPL